MNYLRKKLIYLKQVYTIQPDTIQPDKIWKSEIFTTFKKIHHFFINNLKSEETKGQIKAHLSYLANSFFYNCKPSPRILHQHHVLQNLRKNKYIIMKPNKWNGVVILDWKLYDNAIQKIISEISKFKKLNEDPTLKREASLQRFLRKLKQKNFFNENEYNSILLVMLLLVSMALLKCTNFPLVINSLNSNCFIYRYF